MTVCEDTLRLLDPDSFLKFSVTDASAMDFTLDTMSLFARLIQSRSNAFAFDSTKRANAIQFTIDRTCRTTLVALIGASLLVGCQRTEADPNSTEQVRQQKVSQDFSKILAQPSEPNPADVSVLFLGNSHSMRIPGELKKMFAHHCPGVTVDFRMAPSYSFLDEQSQDEDVIRALKQFKWDYVVLQAQKYSTTGKYKYSIDGAVNLAKMATDNGSKVILYPEFPRYQIDEYERIRGNHEAIAKEVTATIAPIGEAWALAKKEVDAESLYEPDGNHCNGLGNYLNTAVFFKLVCPKDAAKSDVEPENATLFKAAVQAIEEEE